MFNQRANNHQATQLLNPFATEMDGRKSPRPQLNKLEAGYGRPLAGSLTEARGQRANIHVFREMCELCQIICDSGAPVDEDEPNGPKFIFFGELFNVSRLDWPVVGFINLYPFLFPRSTFTFRTKWWVSCSVPGSTSCSILRVRSCSSDEMMTFLLWCWRQWRRFAITWRRRNRKWADLSVRILKPRRFWSDMFMSSFSTFFKCCN